MKNNTTQLNHFLISKFLTYNLHIGGHKTIRVPEIKPYLEGYRNKFCIINPNITLLYFRRALKILIKVMTSKKKILFIGSPIGLEKEFAVLCRKQGHSLLVKEHQGFFTNFKKTLNTKDINFTKLEELPALIFFFSPTKNSEILKEALNLNIPLMGFVNTDEDIINLDFPIPANIKSQKGGFFVYNIFFHIFKNLSLKA